MHHFASALEQLDLKTNRILAVAPHMYWCESKKKTILS